MFAPPVTTPTSNGIKDTRCLRLSAADSFHSRVSQPPAGAICCPRLDSAERDLWISGHKLSCRSYKHDISALTLVPSSDRKENERARDFCNAPSTSNRNASPTFRPVITLPLPPSSNPTLVLRVTPRYTSSDEGYLVCYVLCGLMVLHVYTYMLCVYMVLCVYSNL